jgi:hypothetical protein
MIKMKDEDGNIVEFDEEPTEVPIEVAEEGVEAPVIKKAKKKKVIKKESTDVVVSPIEETPDAVDTLEMIKAALGKGTDIDGEKKPVKKAKKKKVISDEMPPLEENGEEKKDEIQFEADLNDQESVLNTNRKAGGKKAKKNSKKKKRSGLDGIARFFNDYGESPHLQEIEMSYLKYLQA